MENTPRYVGIDLGTTNSAAAVFDGDQVVQVRNSQGGTLTPSIVRIDGRGKVTVGARARRFLESDPDNTRGEFKRVMGTAQEIGFSAAELRPGTRVPLGLRAIARVDQHDGRARQASVRALQRLPVDVTVVCSHDPAHLPASR